jgi:hypothetical protein
MTAEAVIGISHSQCQVIAKHMPACRQSPAAGRLARTAATQEKNALTLPFNQGSMDRQPGH